MNPHKAVTPPVPVSSPRPTQAKPKRSRKANQANDLAPSNLPSGLLDSTIPPINVLIVEDIIDSGLTLHYLMELLLQRRPLSLRVCTLLDKERERVQPITTDYTGFTIPDRFVVGYGLDYAQRYRNLPYIGVLKPVVYQRDDPHPNRQHTSPVE